MKKIIILFLILFISSIYTASSLKTFEINESEKLSLGVKTDDPDADILIYTFTKPLDNKGEWQTTYGDSGEYKALITVSDGENEVSEEVLIVVNRKEAEPVIDDFEPKETFVIIDEGSSIEFKIEASDLNNDILRYEWSLNDEIVSDGKEIVFETGYVDAGEYIVQVAANDGIFEVSREWSINVNDVDLDDILEQIEGISILETETASLELPDFEKYGLSYSISEPLGNDNEWKTGYDDVGQYTVKIMVEGKGFEGEEEVKVTVKNKDRPPKLIGLNNKVVRENEKLSIEIKAVDPDNDPIILSVEDAPENIEFEGNVFSWTPSYDFVQKNDFFDYVLDKFRILRGSINVGFVAQSNKLIDNKNIKISVKDANRPFVLEDINDIEVNEGEDIFIDAKYNDPDKDRVSFSYSGFMDRNKKSTGFDDAGEYIVKVVATDGFFTETKLVNVKVNDTNRKPVFDKIKNLEVSEGNEIRIELNAMDIDNDAVSFSAKNLPEGAKLKDNLFVWKPEFNVVNGTKKEFSVDFIAYDGKDKDEQRVKITVLNVNQAPKIIGFSNNLIVLKDKPTLFEVGVIDEDGDSLTYSWNFGLFSKYEGDNKHQRIFTTAGKKKVEVIIGDGIESVSKVWDVEVI
jgi:hypothetical protein|tara:strand:+ start:1508 stop:3397 length:1890 start_codon:yes stop_codon:yes gene_type:complete